VDAKQYLDQYDDLSVRRAFKSFTAYVRWKELSRLQFVASEVSLTCPCHRMGGTMDVVLVHDKRSIGDYKTGPVYQDHLCQVSAYRHLWDINNPDKPIEGGFHLLRFNKEYGDFDHKHCDELDDAWEAFELMRQLYDLDKKLKKRV
jgi:hypothetical protein